MAVAGVVVEIEMATEEVDFATNDSEIGVSSPTPRTPLNRANTPISLFTTQGGSNNALNTSVFKLS